MTNEVKCENCKHPPCDLPHPERCPEVTYPHCNAVVCDCHETQCEFPAAPPVPVIECPVCDKVGEHVCKFPATNEAGGCSLCEKGFPLRSDGEHYGTQSLGMIPNRRCELLPPLPTSAKADEVPERIWLHRSVIARDRERGCGGYYFEPVGHDINGESVEYVRADTRVRPSEVGSNLSLCSKCGFCQPVAGQEICYSCANGPRPNEVDVEAALVELQTLFPETSFHIGYAYLPKLYRINVPWHDLEVSGKTLAEAMAKVREFAKGAK